MNIQRWIARKEPSWKQLEALLQKAEKQGIRSLTAIEIQSLSSLYRSVSADLARAKTTQASQTLIYVLQGLTSRAYNQVYQGSRRQEWQKVWIFYRWRFPAVVQATWAYTALATALFLLGALLAWWLAWRDPDFIALIAPASLISQVRDRGELWMGNIVGSEPLASSGIMVNNLVVSFRVIAGGITGGLLTTWALFFNGIMIGAIATLVGQNNLAYPFWAFVFPHGALELPAIFFAGGAGFLIARALLFPGQYRRVDAFKIYGTQAAQLVYGIVPMLVIAGTIEGFFSPSPIVPSPLKYLAGLLLLIGLIVYCRQRTPDRSTEIDRVA
ncbi:stage II sporulation protein M [Alkalinema pantanalense CENA528]|uniref:stage II sporulation protein M n=1 Tax=Alkalinema pantanalense TaxID=1620705 RepID=UPI003D6FF981